MANCKEKDCIFICVPDSDYCAKHQKKAQVVEVIEKKATETIRTFIPPKKEGSPIYVGENSSLAIPGVRKCKHCGFGKCQGYCPASQ